MTVNPELNPYNISKGNAEEPALNDIFLDQEMTAAIAYGAPLMPLPVSLKLRLMERLGLPAIATDLTVDTPLKALLDWSLTDLITAASTIEQWTPLGSPEDATYGPWKIDELNRQMAYFVRVPQAGTLPIHHHATGEMVLVLEGDFSVEGARCQTGDRLFSAANTIHQPTTTGCLVFIISSLDDRPVENSIV